MKSVKNIDVFGMNYRDLLRFEVDQPHCINLLGVPLERWESPCALFDAGLNGVHDLRLFRNCVSQNQVRSFNKDAAGLKLVNINSIPLVFYRLGEYSWDYLVYDYHFDDSEAELIPVFGQNAAVLRITLVDAGSGIVKAVRTLNLPPSFSRVLHLAIARQAERRLDGDLDFFSLLADCPSLTALLRMPGVELSVPSIGPKMSVLLS